MVAQQQAQFGSQLVAVGDAAQAIYGWRGAVDAMKTFTVQHRLRLTQSFRFGPGIAVEANKWLALLDTDMRLSGNPGKRGQVVPDLPNPHAILCRGNATVIGELFTALSQGMSVGLVGGGSDLLGVATAAETLMAGRPTDHPEFSLFESWNDLVDYAESGADPNLRVLVKIVEDHGPGAIRHAVAKASHEEHAQLVVSTAHKAKGREWARVRIATDFAEPREDDGGKPTIPPAAELMLSYVAVTRAMEVLDRGNLEWVDNPPDIRSNPERPRGNASQSPAQAATSSGPPTQIALQVTTSAFIAKARAKNPNAYARWAEADDLALLAGYRAGASLTALMAIFGRNEGAIRQRVTKLLGLVYGVQAVFDSNGMPCAAEQLQAPAESSPAANAATPPPEVPWDTWEPLEEPDCDEPDFEDSGARTSNLTTKSGARKRNPSARRSSTSRSATTSDQP